MRKEAILRIIGGLDVAAKIMHFSLNRIHCVGTNNEQYTRDMEMWNTSEIDASEAALQHVSSQLASISSRLIAGAAPEFKPELSIPRHTCAKCPRSGIHLASLLALFPSSSSPFPVIRAQNAQGQASSSLRMVRDSERPLDILVTLTLPLSCVEGPL